MLYFVSCLLSVVAAYLVAWIIMTWSKFVTKGEPVDLWTVDHAFFRFHPVIPVILACVVASIAVLIGFLVWNCSLLTARGALQIETTQLLVGDVVSFVVSSIVSSRNRRWKAYSLTPMFLLGLYLASLFS